MKNGTIQIICGKRNIFSRNQWKTAQLIWQIAHFNLEVANAYMYFESKSMKNGKII